MWPTMLVKMKIHITLLIGNENKSKFQNSFYWQWSGGTEGK